ncbi:probable vesicular glutamate transporter eat-4 [Myzus persicae]|uniref:probable vesicular glutamate transporter eat-4 n=1 Tax=Myzus persicae TaxID=13164 RepID=UPI000B92F822|nr:probable vesicular glutamate transporter eat-4 [Myzus persicae]XP_022164553.1 probable vesicular glutamate transporter eat-4 [Myzus persicae]XP_022164554.1 probable vesicular glutamate transporter eat-4 [Myzus persicae]
MNLGNDETIEWISPSQFQLQEQPSQWSKCIARFIRLKTTYWNRRYAIVLLGLTGIAISWIQFILYPCSVSVFNENMKKQNKIHTADYNCSTYKVSGYFMGLIPSGVLATVYPPHKILGVSIVLFSIGHIILLMSMKYLSAYMHCFTQYYTSMAMATIILSVHGTLVYSVPPNKQSIRHVPIILCWMICNGGSLRPATLNENNLFFYAATLLFGVIGLLWYLSWLYMFNGNRLYRSLKSRYSSNFSDIPWKSFFTSKPLLAIALLYACDDQLNQTIDSVVYESEMLELRKYTIMLLLLFVVLVEIIPEITVSISTISVRKFWSCSYFSLMGIYFFLKAILGYSQKTDRIWYCILKEMKYLYIFGFYLNHLDIAPKYASLLYSLLLAINCISKFLLDNVVNILFSSWIRNEVETGIFKGTVYFAVAVFYDIFASADVQPWAANNPVEGNQQLMVEINNYNNY